MKKARCNVARLAVADLIVQSNMTAMGILNNPVFVNPLPSPNELIDKVNEVSAAIAAAGIGSHHLKLIARDKTKELRTLLRNAIGYVNLIAQGDAVIIASANLNITHNRTLPEAPATPSMMKAVFTNLTGKILLKWIKPAGAKMCNIYISDDPNKSFALLKNVFGSRMMVENLESCKRYYFRLQAVNQVAEGPVSNTISQIAA